MDEATLRTLVATLAAAPDNLGLRVVVVKALLDADQPAAALEHAAGDAPELAVLRARALFATGDVDGARRTYDAAVATNPTLEDRGLRAQLATRAPVGGTADSRRLRVVSNDDTAAADAALAPAAPPVTFADVGGLDDVKAQIDKRIILPFQKPSLFARYRKKAGGGILLYGPPGCGKTLLARATAGQCAATFLNVAIDDILDMWLGESERKLHAVFAKARATPPAVLFFDELEALAGKRQHNRDQTSAKLVSQFLAEMDGFAQNNAGVLILAATNTPWAIDPAFRRPGRFERVLFVPPPDRAARASILALHLRDRPVAADVDVAALAQRTSGFSGADLEHLVDTAADRAIADALARGAEVPIDADHLAGALTEVKPTTGEWLTTARNYARYANEGGQYDEVLEFLARHGKR
ncbi:MAG: ATP-binding protein [Kofleriaceae bacterium]